MNLSLFDYKYPEELVAQRPLAERDASRMMVVCRDKESWRHSKVTELPEFLKKGDLLVVNDSKVVPARLFGKRENGEAIELLVVEKKDEGRETRDEGRETSDGNWRCFLKRARKIRAGEKFFFGMQATAKVKGRDGTYLIVEFKNKALELAMKHHGVPPLPPYIKRSGFKAYTDEDRERYQTVYARLSGSAAAPTAGLHLSEALLKRIEAAGVKIARATLHVGADTFAPVRVEDIAEHKMHGECVEISEVAARAVADAKGEGRRVVAVGTTAVRALESAAAFGGEKCFEWKGGKISAGNFTTDLFIKPGYDFKIVDALLTNFHQPRSTLIVLVSAFAGRPARHPSASEAGRPARHPSASEAGREFILRCYEDAVRERYRLFSYGDCMLIV